MIKFIRTEAPQCLKENYKKWGKEWKEKVEKEKSPKFQWKTYNKEKVNKIICSELVKITNNHCSFCDSNNLGASSQQTIEHFRPKLKHPYLVYTWGNLFLCCNVCQSAKNEEYDKKLLKPDVKGYKFDRYFEIDYKTGEVKPKSSATENDRKRARITIDMYDLNNTQRCHSRIRNYKYYKISSRSSECTIDDFPYRFFLED